MQSSLMPLVKAATLHVLPPAGLSSQHYTVGKPLGLPYLFREEWQFGAREDWRFTDMAVPFGRHWTWVSFFAAYLSQHVLLMGITWPLYTVHSVPAPWHPVWDSIALVVSVTGEQEPMSLCMCRHNMSWVERRSAF